MKKKILWISPFVPYDTVGHAGGKNHNYYLKYLHKTKKYDIQLITLGKKSELRKIDLEKYNIRYALEITDKNILRVLLRKISTFETMYNPFNRYGGGVRNNIVYLLKKLIKEYYHEKSNSNTDIIIFQWTQAALLLPFVKKLYPDSKCICIEEDVCFQSVDRALGMKKKNILYPFYNHRAKVYKAKEIEVLQKADLVVTLNRKDTDLLRKAGIDEEKIFTSVVYFDHLVCKRKEMANNRIIYYGAMGRKENYLSAIWFIENVMSCLGESNVKFTIIGSHPDKSLYKYESEQVEILGFVEDIRPHFENALCMVAPLVLGAGIKVKILEAFSSGIPVLTNHIGIEGIAAEKGTNYLHCESAEEYVEAIQKLLRSRQYGKKIGENGRRFIEENYDLDKVLSGFVLRIEDLFR